VKRMFPFPFPIVPIGFGLIFLTAWSTGPVLPTRWTAALSPLAVLIVIALIVVALAIVVAVVALRNRRSDKQDTAGRVSQTRTTIRRQLDAIANDILELEDEVRASGSDEAHGLFRDATITYAETVGQFETADTIAELSAMAKRLDTAIWQLDGTEAILDGRPAPLTPKAGLTATAPTTRTRHRRETGRRSTAGILSSVIAMLENGSVARPASTISDRSRSRHHC
jgi:hypothetical protein